MNPEFISRVVGLVQKNGDRVVLADPTTGKAVVVLDLESYERLTSVSAAPVSQPVSEPIRNTAPMTPIETVISATRSKMTEIHQHGGDTQVMPKQTEPVADLTREQLMDKINRDIGAWKTAQETKKTEEPISKAPALSRSETRETFEEERFYLEPIE